ncbi:hypothetical protein [Streptomyces violaceorubidus]|uniref:hypothetical protein n=1 Tax=Streptomyces violaceorubidus TaxID=284042 RepID=UPI0004C277BA|nr:hypothetical protein [Streptomyces violaceorubidus]
MPRSKLDQSYPRVLRAHTRTNPAPESIQLEFPVPQEDTYRGSQESVRCVNVVRDLADYVPSATKATKPASSASTVHRNQLRRLAIGRIQRLAATDDWGHRPDPDPVHDADHRTSMSDARIALNVVRGITLADIDPTTGYDVSRQAYERSRIEWRKRIAQQGWDIFTATQYAKVRARWEARHPEWVVDDDWLEGLAGVEAARRELDVARERIRVVVEGAQ